MFIGNQDELFPQDCSFKPFICNWSVKILHMVCNLGKKILILTDGFFQTVILCEIRWI